jgi:hypothetical protein
MTTVSLMAGQIVAGDGDGFLSRAGNNEIDYISSGSVV